MTFQLNDCGECSQCKSIYISATGRPNECVIIRAVGGRANEEKLCRAIVKMFHDPKVMTMESIEEMKRQNLPLFLKTEDLTTVGQVNKILFEDSQRRRLEQEFREQQSTLEQKKRALEDLKKPYLISVTPCGYVLKLGDLLNEVEQFEWSAKMKSQTGGCYRDANNKTMVVLTILNPKDFVELLEKMAKPHWLEQIPTLAAKKRKTLE
jgi:hypothetical protein